MSILSVCEITLMRKAHEYTPRKAGPVKGSSGTLGFSQASASSPQECVPTALLPSYHERVRSRPAGWPGTLEFDTLPARGVGDEPLLGAAIVTLNIVCHRDRIYSAAVVFRHEKILPGPTFISPELVT